MKSGKQAIEWHSEQGSFKDKMSGLVEPEVANKSTGSG
jgi:hypothetical protein